MTKLYKPFENKFREFGFEYNRAEDLYEAMRIIHRLVGSRDTGNIKTMDQDIFGSALIDVAEAFGKLDGRGTSYKFRFESSHGKVYPKR
tara:strand:- start:87 stop:353 length:267 start_codon:yes stop_codon:yes gene_type:complete